jgi:DNA-binding LacI/PurR family transcriptional regulator
MYAEKLCQQYIEQNVDGVFLAPVELASVMYETNLKIAELLDQANIPVVLIDWDIARFPDRSKFDLVGIDNRRVGYLLADHFIKKGCKRIVFVSRRLSAQTIEARIAGYMEAMNNENLSDYISVCLGEPSNPDFIETLLKPEPPEAVICGNDYTAAQLITALLQRNLHIPEDIRIAGIDDVKYAHLLAVPLTSMQQPCIAIGRSAVDAMIDRIASPEMPARSILFDTKLIVRKSSC